MGKGRPRAVEKGVVGQNLGVLSSGPLNIPQAPVYYPSEEEFRDPLDYIYKIRPEAEPYGICKIIPPKSWKPPFALDMGSFTFPTKTQAIHQLQARPSSCDSKTFELEYSSFLEDHCGRKLKKKIIFEGEELDLCKLFNAVKRFGGYDKVVNGKKWGEVSWFVRSGRKVSECAKHVLCQLYREHLFEYEKYYNRLSSKDVKCFKRGIYDLRESEHGINFLGSKRRRRNNSSEKVQVCNLEEELDQECEQCKSGLHGEVMLLCDRCNKGWHIYCLSPPLEKIPPGNWYCLECLNSDKDSFGFVPGKQFSLEAFRRLADRTKRKWFGSGSASRMLMEKKFWEIVEGSIGEVEVIYGSDLDTSIYGSGFPLVNDRRPESIEAKVWDEYCCSPWNLNNLPKLKGSMLRAVHHNITGVMVPWLYVGMLFSSFCWHFEDHCFYSINYLHWGEPKCWYSVPGSEADAFEKVMRNNLPDLFDAQPDLLFQLVTMLNPSVLRESGVPVYTTLQEPGNFVITFPRSYHGGFNFGLNCAEAVNFAPADWLPHGGFGSELYKRYHKSAIISHEELLCVVAKWGDCDSRASPHLKKELLRIHSKEKTWRERLWRSGIVRSSPMSPRKCPEYVGTEEDPTCIICQQYLYLSSIVCRCRPSAFVCLEHWEHLCECKPSKLRLLYRHTLAELLDLVSMVDKYCYETPQDNSLQKQISCPKELYTYRKKVKGGHATLAQLAEKWLSRSRKIIEHAFSSDDYTIQLEEAEQFLWAGSEMDPVRHVVKNLTEAKKWAAGIRNCISKVENWSCNSCDSEKVSLEYVNELLMWDPVPCNEPLHLKLKNHAEEARKLVQAIDGALLTCPSVSELELLYTKACGLPIYASEIGKLLQKISSAKVWIESAKECILDKRPGGVELDALYKLNLEIMELQVQLPETEMILDLLRQAESCRARCNEMLSVSINLKDVELLLLELDGFTVNIPELKLLKQYHNDTLSWISRFNNILVNVHEREDQENVVDELSCLIKDGTSLRIAVDELPLVEIELKKASCREKAQKARGVKTSLDFIQQLIAEAVILQIDGEKLFVDITGMLKTAIDWEERASNALACEAQMFDFEDLMRMSETIGVFLPSLDAVKDAVSVAKSWLKNSKPFIISASSIMPASSVQLEFEALKELVSQSKLLRISFEERQILEKVLKNCEEWEQNACSLLQEAKYLLDTGNVNDATNICLISEIESMLTRLQSTMRSGLSLGFNFRVILELQNAYAKLQWCNKVLSFCSTAPTLEDVETLMETAEHLSSTTFGCPLLWSSLVKGVKWLKRALGLVCPPCSFRISTLSEAEEVLAESKNIEISFQVVICQLQNAIQEHKLWQNQVDQFFSMKFEERSWSQILHIKELGKSSAFGCSELDMVLYEVEKVEKWEARCIDVVGAVGEDANLLLVSLQKIKLSLDKSLYIYERSWDSEGIALFKCCIVCSGDQATLTCSRCKDCYHLECLGQIQTDRYHEEQYLCPYCHFFEDGSLSLDGVSPLKFVGKRPDIKLLVELLADAKSSCTRIEETCLLEQIVEQAVRCSAHSAEIVGFASSYLDTDLCTVAQKLTTALKAFDIAGVYDHKADSDLALALARNSWRIRVSRLIDGSHKPTIQQIQKCLKEGLSRNIPPEDHFMQRLLELKHIGLQWAEHAKKVSQDSGDLCLEKVFELITEGENLAVYLEKELKALSARSMLYCICLKPLDQRTMIACDQCGEWYHRHCIKLPSPVKIYICAACCPQTEQLVNDDRSTSTKFVEPETPLPQETKSKKVLRGESSPAWKMLTITSPSSIFRNGIDSLWWRNRKPFRRATKKHADFDHLSPFCYLQQQSGQ